jgi:NitT/TauT family transport system substrate-binding protein
MLVGVLVKKMAIAKIKSIKTRYKIIGVIILVVLVVSLVAGIEWQHKSNESAQVEIAYAGGTCEAPVFVAYKEGFFKEEGLNVELIQAGSSDLTTGLDSGKIAAAEANFQWFEQIAQGLDVKLTAGIHSGCISLVTPTNSTIKTVADLAGKAVGVESIGGGPQIALLIALKELGIDPNTITWTAYPGDQLNEAVAKGEIVAYITWDPFPSEAVSNDGYTSLLNIGTDAPFNDSYCCFVGVSGKVVKNNPAEAAAITKAILKGAEWVGENPQESAQIEIDNSYVGGTVQLNAALLASYNWHPSVSQAETNAQWWITEEQAAGILSNSTSVNTLYNQVFAQVITDSEIPSA